MAISSSKSTTLKSSNNYAYTLTASFTENSISIANNTSNVSLTGTLKSNGASWSSSYNSTLQIYWHDNKNNSDVLVATKDFKSLNYNASTSVSGTINVSHNDDGALSGYAYAKFTKGGSSAYTPLSGGVSTNWTPLSYIARASVPTIAGSNNFNIGDTITINMNRKSSQFTHTVTFYFGNFSQQIGTGITNSVSFDTSTIANQMYQQIPNADVGVGNVTVITYNGSTVVGQEQVLFYAHVVNSNPTCIVSYQDTNATTLAITNNNQQIIRNNSTLQVNITSASAKNYATLSSVKITMLGQSTTRSISGSSLNINLGTINLSSNTDMQITLIDSRGLSSTYSMNIQMLNWVLPSAIITLQRQNNYYTETDITVNADYSSLDNKNTLTIKYRYKQAGASTYSSYYDLSDGVLTTFNIDNTKEWDVQVLLTDKIGSTTYNLFVPKGVPITFFDRLKRSVGVNCFPEDSESLEVNGENVMNRIEGFGEVCMSAPTNNWNTACGTRSGFYMGADMSNSPSGSTVANWWWVIHLAHNDNYQRQIAFSFLENNGIYTRIKNNGTWGSWTQV